MENKEKNYIALYLTLGGCATILILSGIFLPEFLEIIKIEAKTNFISFLQIAFIVSGLMDFGLLFYAKKKLS